MNNIQPVDKILKKIFADDIQQELERGMEDRSEMIIDELLANKQKNKFAIFNSFQIFTPLKQLSFGLLSVIIIFIGVYQQLYGSHGKLSSSINVLNSFGFTISKINLGKSYIVNVDGVPNIITGTEVIARIKKNGVLRSINNILIQKKSTKNFIPDKGSKIKYIEFMKNNSLNKDQKEICNIYWEKGDKK